MADIIPDFVAVIWWARRDDHKPQTITHWLYHHMMDPDYHHVTASLGAWTGEDPGEGVILCNIERSMHGTLVTVPIEKLKHLSARLEKDKNATACLITEYKGDFHMKKWPSLLSILTRNFNCVEVIKSMIGMSDKWIWSPVGLYRAMEGAKEYEDWDNRPQNDV